MLKVRQGLHHNVLLVAFHAAGTLAHRADGNALGKGHAHAGGHHRVAGAGQVVVGQVIHAAHGLAVHPQGAPNGALVAAGLDQRGDGGFAVDDGAHLAFGFRHIFRIAHQGAGNGHGHIVLNAVAGAAVDGEGGKVVAVALADDGAGDGVHLFIGGHFVIDVLVLGKLVFQFVRAHGLVDQLLVFRAQAVVFRLQVGAELEGAHIPGDGFGHGGKGALDGGDDLCDKAFGLAEHIGRAGNHPVEHHHAQQQHNHHRDGHQQHPAQPAGHFLALALFLHGGGGAFAALFHAADEGGVFLGLLCGVAVGLQLFQRLLGGVGGFLRLLPGQPPGDAFQVVISAGAEVGQKLLLLLRLLPAPSVSCH